MDGVATVRLADAACIGCGMCEEVCPHGVFAVAERKARILDRNACMECGACAMNFTGATPFTSPSGVEKEMRRALPVQAGLTVLAGLLWVGGAFFR